MCCSVLQCVAVFYSVLQRVRSMASARIGGLVKSRVRDFAVAGDGAQDAGRCNTLQHAATRCNTLQHTNVQAKVEGAPTECSTTEGGAL